MSYPPNQPPGDQPPYGGQQPYGQQPYGQQPYGQPQYGGYPPPPGGGEVGSDNATLALILGIVGIVCCAPCGIAAFIMGNNAKKEAERTGRPLNGTMNTARILGIIGCVLLAIGIVFFLISLATGNFEFNTSTN
jgi:hypothetical protein